MSQNDLVIANQSFPSFRTDLNSALQAINTSQSGTSRPSGAVAGTIWLDTTSATSPTLKYYDGADDISLATIDHVGNTVNWLDSTVSVTGLTTTATGTVLTLSDSSLTSSVNLILQNQKEIRFSETTANGTNYVGFKAPASLSADKIWILPSADGTAGQFLKTDGAGNLSFDSLSFSTPLAVIGNATSGSEIRLPEDTDNGSNYVALKAADTIASNLTLTLPSADGTSGQVLQTNGSGVLSFSSVSSDYVLIKTQTASSASSVAFVNGSNNVVFDSTYSVYFLIGYNMYNSTSVGEPEIHITTDSGSTYKTSGYKTVKRRLFESGDAISLDGTGVSNDHIGASFMNLETDSSYASHFYAYFWNPSNSSARPKVFSQWNNTTSTYTSGYTIMQGVYNTAGAYNGFRIEPNVGTINGTFKLYGIK